MISVYILQCVNPIVCLFGCKIYASLTHIIFHWLQEFLVSFLVPLREDFATVTSWLGQSASCDGKGAPITGGGANAMP